MKTFDAAVRAPPSGDLCNLNDGRVIKSYLYRSDYLLKRTKTQRNTPPPKKKLLTSNENIFTVSVGY